MKVEIVETCTVPGLPILEKGQTRDLPEALAKQLKRQGKVKEEFKKLIKEGKK
jgi:hypothetical protein